MPTVIINGKRVNVPSSTTPEGLISASGSRVNPGTRAVIKTTTGGNTKMKSGQNYQIREGDKYKFVPDRVKASDATYFGYKEPWRQQLITEQVFEVAQKFFKKSRVELDDDCNWVVFERFLLPEEWQRANPGKSFVPMMLIFPDQYPELPTNGFYLPASLQLPPNAEHFYSRGYGGAFGQTEEEMEFMRQGQWKWFCTHIKPGAWSPARLREISDWRHGDNLWDIITLCVDVLTHPLDD
ncbi:MAG: hypothetical protein IJ774_02955 [Selenomonadaceae bacterium]|nr:hypothetical protein [Selenomonadaceae bacterium]